MLWIPITQKKRFSNNEYNSLMPGEYIRYRINDIDQFENILCTYDIVMFVINESNRLIEAVLNESGIFA